MNQNTAKQEAERKNHKWERMPVSVEAYRCVNCLCQKYIIKDKWGKWEYLVNNKLTVKRPDCKHPSPPPPTK